MFVKISGIKIEKGNILNKYSNLGLLSLENYDLRINRKEFKVSIYFKFLICLLKTVLNKI